LFCRRLDETPSSFVIECVDIFDVAFEKRLNGSIRSGSEAE